VCKAAPAGVRPAPATGSDGRWKGIVRRTRGGGGGGGSSDPVEVVAASETHSERPTVEAVPRRWGTAALPRAGGRGCHLRVQEVLGDEGKLGEAEPRADGGQRRPSVLRCPP
jgi:hypothetical protein